MKTAPDGDCDSLSVLQWLWLNTFIFSVSLFRCRNLNLKSKWGTGLNNLSPAWPGEDSQLAAWPVDICKANRTEKEISQDEEPKWEPAETEKACERVTQKD